jgi:hypothetical protein
VADFPRGRVLARALRRTNAVLTQFWWVPVVTAVLSAVGGSLVAAQSHTHVTVVIDGGARVLHIQESGPSWAKVFLGSLVVGAGGYLLVAIGLFLWNLGSYRLTGRHDRDWRANFGGFAAERGLAFELLQRSAHADIGDLRVMECIIRSPSGRLTTIANGEMLPRRDGVFCWCPADGAGTYEVRWYGSTPKGKFYEVTRMSVLWRPEKSASIPSS